MTAARPASLCLFDAQRVFWKSHRKLLALAVLSLITAAKILSFVGLTETGRAKPFIGDNARYIYIPVAQRILHEGRFNGPDSRPDSKIPPGYPVMIAAALALTPSHFLLLVVCGQMLLDFLVAFFIYLLAREILPWEVATAAAAAWLIYPPAVLISTWITAETLFTALLMGSIAILLVSLRRNSVPLSIAAGLLLGVATLVRGTTILLPIALAPIWIVKRRYIQAVTFCCAMACIIVPWSIRNFVVLHDRILVSVGIGSVFLQGSDEKYFTGQGKASGYGPMFEQAAAEGIRKPQSNLESAIDSWMLRVGENNLSHRLRERPWSLPLFYAKKFLRLWYATENETRAKDLRLALCSVLVVPAAFWQLWIWRRTHFVWAVTLGGVTLYFIFLHTLTLPLFRYMFPIFPFFVLAAVQRYANLVHLQTVVKPAKSVI